MVGVRRWVGGVGVAGGAAVAAAMIGASVAHADTIDDFLLQAEGDMSQTATLFSGLDSSSMPSSAGLASLFEGQDALITQIQGQQDMFSDSLQSSSQLIDADQQLADASGNLVAASQTFVNAVNAGDLPLSTTETYADKLTGAEAIFGFLNAELLQVLPAEFNAGFTTILDGGTVDFNVLNSGDAVIAASASATDPATLLSPGSADLSQAGTVLSGIDLTGQTGEITTLIPKEIEVIGSQEGLQTALGNIQSMIVDEQAQGSTSLPGYALVTEATNALFTNADQNLLNADAALLASDQVLAGAISSGTGYTDLDTLEAAGTLLGLAGADLGALGTSIDAAFTPLLGLF